MTIKVGIINYGIGNIRSLKNSLKKINIESDYIINPKNLNAYDKVFLPGVGSYYDAIKSIKKLAWEKSILDFCYNKKKNLFGICVGMQILSTIGYEFRESLGLNIIPGAVENLKKLGCTLKIPHIGWNEIIIKKESFITKNIPNKSSFYFVNSFAYKLENDAHLIAYTNYGVTFPSIIQNNNICGTQFHPEKSSKAGLQILKNFIDA